MITVLEALLEIIADDTFQQTNRTVYCPGGPSKNCRSLDVSVYVTTLID
jgi:hypothetical protein